MSKVDRTQESVAVDLPEAVVSRVESRVRSTEFDSPAEYITYVVSEVLVHVEQETDETAVVDVDERDVKDRLESLGYLNE